MEIIAERGLTVDLVKSLSQGGLDWTPRAEVWSAGEIMHHVAKTELQIAKVIELLAANQGIPPGQALEPGTFTADGRPIAPRSTWPERLIPKEGLLGVLAEGQAALQAAWSAYERAGSPDLTFQHPFYGDLRARSWLKTQAGHERHHRGQVGRLRSLQGFPLAG